MINERYELPVKLGLTALWAGAVLGMYYLSERAGDPLVIRFYEFMLINPLLLLVASFMTAKIFGGRWYYKAAVIAASAVIYFATPMKSVVPSLPTVTAICVILGAGTGGVFSDKGNKDADEKREHYTPILEQQSTNGNKRNKKKKAKRK